MIYTAVQFVQYPGGARIDQQVRRAADQVVVIEQARGLLVRGVGVQHGRGEGHQRGRYRRNAQRQAGVDRFEDAVALGQENSSMVGMPVEDGLADEATRGARLAFLGEELVAPMLPVFVAVGRFQAEPAEDPAGAFGASLRAELLDDQGGLAQLGFGLPVDGTGDDVGLGLGGDAQGAALRRFERFAHVEGAFQAGEIGLQGGDVAAELVGRDEAREGSEGGAHGGGTGVREHVLARLGQGVLGVAIVNQAEVRGERCFQREAAQQRLAEGVDGADLHAAGEVEHRCEQGTGGGQDLAGWLDVEGAEFGGQKGVVEGDPFAEGILEAHGHLGGSGLGEGEALDAFGLGAGQHEAEQAIGEELGLAGTRRGGDERGDRRVGGLELFDVGSGAGGGSIELGFVWWRPLPLPPSRKGRGSDPRDPRDPTDPKASEAPAVSKVPTVFTAPEAPPSLHSLQSPHDLQSLRSPQDCCSCFVTGCQPLRDTRELGIIREARGGAWVGLRQVAAAWCVICVYQGA